jgi:hypothetical protein
MSLDEVSAFSAAVLHRCASLAIGASHPRVFLDIGALAQLRARAFAGDPVLRAIRADATARARLVSPPHPENEPDGGILRLAFAFSIWRQEELLTAVLDGLPRLLEADTWVADLHRGLRVDIRSAVVCSSLALAADLLWQEIPAPLRSRLVETLDCRDLGLLGGIHRGQSESWTRRRTSSQAMISSHLGLALLALADVVGDWRDRLRLVLDGLLDFLDHCPPDGSFPEGVTHWHRGVGELAWFALALRTVSGGGLNLFHHPYLRATARFAVYMSTPDGCFDFDDCCNFHLNDWLIALLAREYRNPILQGMTRRFPEAPAPPIKVDVPARGMREVLARDDTLPAAGRERMPCSRHFPDADLVVMRSGWDEGATFVAVQGGSNGASHGHLDAGSFIVGCAGRRVIPDGGAWPYTKAFFDYDRARWDFDAAATIGHNALLVDGRGQQPGPGGRAPITDVELGGEVEWVVCDVTAAYGGTLERFVRYLLFCKPRSLVVVDDVASHERRRLRWLLHHVGRARLEPRSVLIEDGGVSASVTFPCIKEQGPYRFTSEQRRSYYATDGDRGSIPGVRLISVDPSVPLARWTVVAVIQLSAGDRSAAGIRVLGSGGERLSLALTPPGSAEHTLRLDLASRTVELISRTVEGVLR